MRAKAVETARKITVMTKNTIAGRQAVTNKPSVHLLSFADRASVFIPFAFNMVKGKKLVVRFTTTSALNLSVAIVRQDLQPSLSQPLFRGSAVARMGRGFITREGHEPCKEHPEGYQPTVRRLFRADQKASLASVSVGQTVMLRASATQAAGSPLASEALQQNPS